MPAFAVGGDGRGQTVGRQTVGKEHGEVLLALEPEQDKIGGATTKTFLSKKAPDGPGDIAMKSTKCDHDLGRLVGEHGRASHGRPGTGPRWLPRRPPYSIP